MDGIPSSSSHKSEVRLARVQHPARVLGVELHADEERVLLEFDNLHTFTLVVLSDEVQTSLGEPVDVLRINLVSVTVTLENLASFRVELSGLGPF